MQKIIILISLYLLSSCKNVTVGNADNDLIKEELAMLNKRISMMEERVQKLEQNLTTNKSSK